MPEYRWKTLDAQMQSPGDPGDEETPWTIGEWKTNTDIFRMSALHVSRTMIEALMASVHPSFMAKVEVCGPHRMYPIKEYWEKIRIMQVWPWTTADSMMLAISTAELVLPVYAQCFPYDDRPGQAIIAARAYVASPTARARTEVVDAADAAIEASVEAVAVLIATDEAGEGDRAMAAGTASVAAATAVWAARAVVRSRSAAAEAAMCAVREAQRSTTAINILERCEQFINARLHIDVDE
jgi:hypothetical protein